MSKSEKRKNIEIIQITIEYSQLASASHPAKIYSDGPERLHWLAGYL